LSGNAGKHSRTVSLTRMHPRSAVVHTHASQVCGRRTVADGHATGWASCVMSVANPCEDLAVLRCFQPTCGH
jgi:hypothetical protein